MLRREFEQISSSYACVVTCFPTFDNHNWCDFKKLENHEEQSYANEIINSKLIDETIWYNFNGRTLMERVVTTSFDRTANVKTRLSNVEQK